MTMLTFRTKVDAEDYIFENYDWDSLSDLERLYSEYIFTDYVDKRDSGIKEYLVPISN